VYAIPSLPAVHRVHYALFLRGTTMISQLRVAILGGGRMAQKHATAIRQQPAAKLVAVVDPFLASSEIAARFGSDVEAFNDPISMLERVSPDIVHIVTPPNTHFPLARECLNRGASIYVEKPFALSEREAAEVLNLADQKGLRVCAAHQVLFQRAGQLYQTHLPMIGDLIHVESYFSFKPVRRRPDGGTPLSAVDQLIDILPHPVYLMLSALDRDGAPTPELTALDVAPEGEARAVIRAGKTLATLIVTLRGRPVESYLRVVGTNGSVTADFILGDIVRLFGPGASAPAVVIKPFKQAWQKYWGSFTGLARLLFRRQKSYPGLAELFEAFYSSIRSGTAPPISRSTILNTVRICEQISTHLIAADQRSEAETQLVIEERARCCIPIAPNRDAVFVTGGSGFLGRSVLKELRERGWPVRALVRRKPSAKNQVAGIEYVEGDLAKGISKDLLRNVAVIAHLAAETAGDMAAHERNTVVAMRNLLDAMEAANVTRLVNISSVAVLRPGPSVLREDSAVDRGNLSRGPYVWAKAEAEAIGIERAAAGKVETRTIRLGPLVDFANFTAPGRLGREISCTFVAMGRPSSPLSVCDVETAAQVVRYYTEHFEAAPPIVNLVEVPATTRGHLAGRLRTTRPEFRFVWVPFPILKLLSMIATFLQKLIRPKHAALNVYAAFKSENYDPAIAQWVITAARAGCDEVVAQEPLQQTSQANEPIRSPSRASA
jgi:predicted dehydrogenase/nucleoside-diphosphate-sugar epimerase